MEIKRHGSRALDACEQVFQCGRQHAQGAYRAIDVKPDFLRFGDPGDLLQRIDGAGTADGSSRPHHEEGAKTLRAVFATGSQRLGHHAAGFVDGDGAQVRGTDAR